MANARLHEVVEFERTLLLTVRTSDDPSCVAVPDGITLTLAVVGAAGTVAHVYTTFRDRPRLRFDAHTTDAVDRPPALTVTVFNVGTRPTTVREVGFYAHKSPVVIKSQTKGTLHGEAELGAVIAKGVFLEAGQSRTFDATESVLRSAAWADEPLRLYARDIHGRRIWGGAARMIRMLFGPEADESNVPPPLQSMFMPTPKEHLLPAQVEPPWKVWKRRELRKPSVWKGD